MKSSSRCKDYAKYKSAIPIYVELASGIVMWEQIETQHSTGLAFHNIPRTMDGVSIAGLIKSMEPAQTRALQCLLPGATVLEDDVAVRVQETWRSEVLDHQLCLHKASWLEG